MNLIEWEEKYSTGVMEIDREHHKIVNEINELWQDCTKNNLKRSQKMAEFLVKTIDHVKEHVSREDQYIKSRNKKLYKQLMQKHQQMLEDIQLITEDYSIGLIDYAPETALKKMISAWCAESVNGIEK